MAVADELRARGASVSFLGTRNRVEAELIPSAGYELDFLSVLGIDRRNPLRAAAAITKAAGATSTARRALRKRNADVVMGGGGFVAGPAGLAAVSLRIPLVLTEADSHIGLANRLLASRAKRVCLAFPIPGREGDPYLLTGRPIPKPVLDADRGAARGRFGIPADARCLLVIGGSQGARSINGCVLAAFASEGSDQPYILHIAGRRDYPELRARLDEAGGGAHYTMLEYEPNLGDCLAAADLVLGRSGGSIFEVIAAGRPAILVPYPFATGAHQASNAAWVADQGAAIVVPDSDLEAARLRELVAELFAPDGRLDEMSAAARGAARPDAAMRIADEVLAAAGADR